MAKKKSINDTDFFSDENLEAMAEAIEVLDPDADAGADDGEGVVGDDATAAEVSADEAGGDDDDADESASDEEPVGDDTDPEGAAGKDDPAPHLTDLETAKVAYAELRKWANQRDMAARKAEEERLKAEEEFANYDYGDDEPVYDAQAFAHIAGQDPRAAFKYAMEGGNTTDAQTAIAQVQADAAELAALAAIANREGDKEAYAQYHAQAANVAALAQSLQGEYQTAVLRVQQAPFVAAEQKRNLETAENHLAAQAGAEYTTRRDQVIQVLRERPHLITGHTAQEIHRGLSDAFTIAKSMPAPVSAVPDIDSVVKEAVEKQMKAVRAAKARAANDAQGASGARTGPPATSNEPSLKDEIYAGQAAASIGARKFMDL